MSFLEVKDLHAGYGRTAVLHGVDLSVEQGEIAAVLGPNGAGKTTTLRALSGLVSPTRGSITLDGEEIAGVDAEQIVALGMSHVPEGRGVFPQLTVEENLRLGGYLIERKAGVYKENFERVMVWFPVLKDRLKQASGTLSGGEQQMLAIGRALMSKPRFLMLDEPSLGIAPILVQTIFQKIVEINKTLGITILLVEQNANLALEVSHYGYVLETGRIILHDKSSALRVNERVKSAYLGGG